MLQNQFELTKTQHSTTITNLATSFHIIIVLSTILIVSRFCCCLFVFYCHINLYTSTNLLGVCFTHLKLQGLAIEMATSVSF